MTGTAGQGPAVVRALVAARGWTAEIEAQGLALVMAAARELPPLAPGTDCELCGCGAWCHPTPRELTQPRRVLDGPTPWWVTVRPYCAGAGCACQRLRGFA